MPDVTIVNFSFGEAMQIRERVEGVFKEMGLENDGVVTVFSTDDSSTFYDAFVGQSQELRVTLVLLLGYGEETRLQDQLENLFVRENGKVWVVGLPGVKVYSGDGQERMMPYLRILSPETETVERIRKLMADNGLAADIEVQRLDTAVRLSPHPGIVVFDTNSEESPKILRRIREKIEGQGFPVRFFRWEILHSFHEKAPASASRWNLLS